MNIPVAVLTNNIARSDLQGSHTYGNFILITSGPVVAFRGTVCAQARLVPRNNSTKTGSGAK